MRIPVPSVWINHQSKIALVVKSEGQTIWSIQIDETALRWDTKASRIQEFYKEFDEAPVDPKHAVMKILTSTLVDITPQAKKELKEIVMTSALIIVVTATAEFVGRFMSGKDASKAASSTDKIIYNAEGLTEFSKAELASALGMPTDKDSLKKHTVAQLAELVHKNYMEREVTVPEKPEKKEKAPKVEKPKHVSKMDQIINRLQAGEVLNLVALMAELETSEGTIRSIISNIRSEKYMGDTPTVPALTGKVGGQTVFFLEEFTPENLDPKATPAEKKAKSGEPRKPGAKSLIREALLDGTDGYTIDELKEIAGGVEKKIVSDMLAYLKNPKYCGAEGPLEITRDPETKKYKGIALGPVEAGAEEA